MVKTHKQKQKRLIMLIAPVVLGILVAFFFYGLGGGAGNRKMEPEKKGLNTQLPDAMPDDKNPLDKLSIYRKAEKDSAKMREQLVRDPYFNRMMTESGLTNNDPQQGEKKLIDKLSLLENQLNKNSSLSHTVQTNPSEPIHYQKESVSAIRPKSNVEKDEELEQLNELMTKALDIKYPERVQEREQEKTKALQQLALLVDVKQVHTVEEDSVIGFSATENPIAITNRFYELSDENMQVQQGTNAIAASIHESQSIINGSEVKLQLDQDVTIKGINIPSGTFLFAKAQLGVSRVQLSIENIHYDNQFLPVALDVYSYDGMIGIPLTDEVTEEVAKQGAGKGLQAIQLNNLSTGIGAQVATAGIETAKNLIGRKTKIIKIKLKGGHPVLLRNTNK